MIALLQRVTEARVSVEGRTVGEIGPGVLALVCAERGDTVSSAERLVERILAFRLFADGAGKMNLSVRDTDGGLLLVPQFTLAADTRGGNRPSFSAAADPALGRSLFAHALAQARAAHAPVATGEFGAHMQVSLVNDGPVTFWLRVDPPA
ncbi:MAG: D-aminoacyl-tRNA deacylase [Burkholderiales bacterium]